MPGARRRRRKATSRCKALISEGHFLLVTQEEGDQVSYVDEAGIANWIRGLVNPLRS